MKKILGFIVFLGILAAAIAFSGSINYFVDLPSLIVVIGATAGMTLISYRKDMTRNDICIRLKRYSIYSGWLLALIGVISYLGNLASTFDVRVLGICILGLFYGYLASFIIDCLIQ